MCINMDIQVFYLWKLIKIIVKGKILINDQIFSFLLYSKVQCIYLPNSDIDECLRNPCQNLSPCTNSPGSYSCACSPQWTGQNCDIGKYNLLYNLEFFS